MTIESREEDNVEYDVNIIGAGGIASWVLHGLVRPARRFAQATGRD